jgi:hypothetical protein
MRPDLLTSRRAISALALLLVAALPGAALPGTAQAQLVRSAAGTGAAAVTAARDQFRLDLGGGNVAGANGLFGGVRREINWDGVPAGFAAPNALPANFFNVNSPRGVVFGTPGTSFQVSNGPTDFGDINATYTDLFEPFSPARLFTALGSNVVDVNFFVAGTATPALTRGFGSIFSDVDLANTTSIQLFDAQNVSLGTFFAPNVVGATAPTFSFLGVSYADAIISRARITNGNTALGPNDSQEADVVVMDDFLYGETVAVIPEPGTWALLATGLAGLGVVARRRRR